MNTEQHKDAREAVNEWYKGWCKRTGRNGGVLIGKSIHELLDDFAAQKTQPVKPVLTKEQIAIKHGLIPAFDALFDRVLAAMEEYAAQQVQPGERWVKASERLPENRPIYDEICYCVRWSLDEGKNWFYGSAPGRSRIEPFHEWLDESPASPDQPSALDVIRKAYAETRKINFGDPDNEMANAFRALNEVQDILGLYLEGEYKMWDEEYASPSPPDNIADELAEALRQLVDHLHHSHVPKKKFMADARAALTKYESHKKKEA